MVRVPVRVIVRAITLPFRYLWQQSYQASRLRFKQFRHRRSFGVHLLISGEGFPPPAPSRREGTGVQSLTVTGFESPSRREGAGGGSSAPLRES